MYSLVNELDEAKLGSVEHHLRLERVEGMVDEVRHPRGRRAHEEFFSRHIPFKFFLLQWKISPIVDLVAFYSLLNHVTGLN